jgi:hypothetical protein
MPKPAPAHVTAHSNALKEHVCQLLALDADDIVLTRQLACTEPGCPPLETVVAVLPTGGAARRWTLHPAACSLRHQPQAPRRVGRAQVLRSAVGPAGEGRQYLLGDAP